MPGQTIEGLRLFQWGKEATRGTLVPATSKIAVENLELAPVDDMHRPKLAKGLLHRNPANEVTVRRGSTLKVPQTPVTYDQITNWLGMSVKGGVVATGVSPYTYLYAHSLTADPVPDTFTIERRTTDGTTPRDFRFGYAFLSEIKFLYQIDKPLMFEASGFCRRIQTNALTAAQVVPVVEIPPAPLAKIYIDASWAALGTTQLTATVVRAAVSFKTGLKPKYTFDSRADLDWSTYVFDARNCGLDVEIDLMWAAQVDTEKVQAEAAALRAIRFDITGTASRELKIDMLLKHEQGSVFAIGQEDGQDIVRLKLQDSDDGTNMLAVTAVNTIAAVI